MLDNKYYVRGIGEVKEIAVKGSQERLELVDIFLLASRRRPVRGCGRYARPRAWATNRVRATTPKISAAPSTATSAR